MLLRYALRQCLQAVPTLFGITFLVFMLIRLTPGDPAVAMLGPHATTESLAALRESLRLDEPVTVQFTSYMAKLLQGDLGESLSLRRPILGEIVVRAPHTIALTLAGTLVTVLVGVPLGVVSAVRRNTFFDKAIRMLSLIGVSAPLFLIGTLMLLVFSIYLNLFPVTGSGSWSEPLKALHYLILPSLTIGLVQAALIMRLTRSAMLEILGEDYIRTAKAKGLHTRLVHYKHALKNASIPIVTAIGLNMGQLLGGAVVTETLFARSGLGRLLLEGVIARDYPLVQGMTLVFATGVVLINITMDITYSLFDPRVRFQ